MPLRGRVAASADDRSSADAYEQDASGRPSNARSPVAPRTTVAGAGTAIGSRSVDENEASRWYGEYLKVFEACGRGESDAGSLLAYYGVPLLVATDDEFIALSTEEQVVAAAQQQIDGMRAAAYNHSDVLGSEVTVLNHTSALYRGEFSRRRADGDEISRLTVTYLLTDGPVGRRISALVLHSP